jgi:hypothetical protein
MYCRLKNPFRQQLVCSRLLAGIELFQSIHKNQLTSGIFADVQRISTKNPSDTSAKTGVRYALTIFEMTVAIISNRKKVLE